MVLLIDNYDSFTYNLAHYLGVAGAQVRVVRNDAMSIAEIAALAPERIVISPGPGRPESAGVSIDAVRSFAGKIPILGVCLGHQAISIAFGGKVDRAEALMHGKTSRINHDGSPLFDGIPQGFEAGRYHSLLIPEDGLPSGFVCAARTLDGATIMSIRHEHLPIFGVQFHPESVLTPMGQRLLRNFLNLQPARTAGSSEKLQPQEALS